VTRLPDYIGVSALGIKMGVVVPGSDILRMVYDSLVRCDSDGLLDSGDVICITESVVARAQNNYVTTDHVAEEVQEKLKITPASRIGVLFPLLSRNRFSLVLKGLAKAVCQGEVVLQLAYPTDEVGNLLLSDDLAGTLGNAGTGVIALEDIGNNRTRHPITGIDYISVYEEIVKSQGARATIYLCNDPTEIAKRNLDGVVVASVHSRHQVKGILLSKEQNCITLQELCHSGNGAWSEWGLLGSNMSSADQLKLAPRQGGALARQLQSVVTNSLGKHVEVLIYGDGAYKDPSTGIYELADPQPCFGMTEGLEERYRRGFKYKYIVDQLWYKGSNIEDIEHILESKKKETPHQGASETEGTTPRRVEDLLASLADLVSGSSDAGTPLVLVKGFLR
jgi:F420-0:gamma-glutamyl ligase